MNLQNQHTHFHQCPFNVFDDRIVTSGWIDRLEGDGVSVHARSVFLQGVLLKPMCELDGYFSRWEDTFDAWEVFCMEKGVSKLKAALSYVLCEERIDKCIVGVESRWQFKQILDACQAPLHENFAGSHSDIELVNPLKWRIHGQ